MGAMRMSGLFESVYWLSNFLTFGLLMFFSFLLMYVISLAWGFYFVVNTDAGVVLVLFWLYGLATLAMAFAFGAVIQRVRVANIFSLAYFLVGFIYVAAAANLLAYVLVDPHIFSADITNVLMLYPPLAFAKVFKDISVVTAPTSVWDSVNFKLVTVPGGYYSWSNLYNGTYMYISQSSLSGGGNKFFVPPSINQLNWFLVVFFTFYVLAWYLSQAFPFEQGREQPLWFPLMPSFWYQRSDSVEAFADSSNSTVRAAGLRRVFGNFTAVDGVDLKFKEGTVYALLGHNGAGKTTTIKLMTGALAPNSGDCIIAGYSVNSQISAVRQVIGVCPQHDVLWDDLTAQEHLETFGMFRGRRLGELAPMIALRLEDSRLAGVKDHCSKTYSGEQVRVFTFEFDFVCLV